MKPKLWFPAVLLLASVCLASPYDRDRDRNDHRDDRRSYDRDRDHDRDGQRKYHTVPEPGPIAMVTLTAGLLVGGLIARRRVTA
jgi:hypothetical protein